MKQITVKQQAEVNKMSTERFRMRLVKADYEEEVASLDRAALKTTFANYLLEPHPIWSHWRWHETGGTGVENGRRRQKELEMAEEQRQKEFQQEIELKRL